MAESPHCAGENIKRLARCVDGLCCSPDPQPEHWAITILRNGLGSRVASGLLFQCRGCIRRIGHHFNANLVHGLTPSHSISIATESLFSGENIPRVFNRNFNYVLRGVYETRS